MSLKPLIDQETTRLPGERLTPRRLADVGFILIDSTLGAGEECATADLERHVLDHLHWRRNFYTRLQHHLKVCEYRISTT